MRRSERSNVIERASDDKHVKGYGKNFKPLVSSGSWEISGFHYGKSKCACCGRPIQHVLHLKNSSHADAVATNPNYPFVEEIEIGIVCGPKVFTESCVGFYSDPSREWERQIKAWKDYINYVILCVKNEDIWQRVPEELRVVIDEFLAEGYKNDDTSSRWWLVKDAKKKYLKTKRSVATMPDARLLYWQAQTLVYAAKRLKLIPLEWSLKEDMTLNKSDPTVHAVLD